MTLRWKKHKIFFLSKQRKSSQRKLQVSSPLLQFFKGSCISFGNTLTIPDARNYLNFPKSIIKKGCEKVVNTNQKET